MKSDFANGALTIFLEGRIDSTNADVVESELKEIATLDKVNIVFDATDLVYISSAGLRVLLKIKQKTKSNIRIINVSDDVFDIFEITGFSDIFEIERQMRTISIKGCKKISSAINGEIFQHSDDEMIKVFAPTIPLSEIKKERAYAQTAMIAGVPTTIPYDVVKCEQGYGIIYEKLEMTSIAYILSRDTSRIEEYARKLGKLMKELHSCKIAEGKLPDIKDRYRQWIKDVDDPSDSKLTVFSSLIDSIPDSTTYVHGDINLNSVMDHDGELLLLDMAGSARGNALFDLQGLFASLVAIEKTQEGYCRRTFGLSQQTCMTFWNVFFDTYMDHDHAKIASMQELLLKYFVLKETVLTKLENKNRIG